MSQPLLQYRRHLASASSAKAIAAMNVHDYETAAMEFLDSRWASQVGTRALDVTDMIRTGDYNE